MKSLLPLPLLTLALVLFCSGCSYQAPVRVAVLNFENATGDPQYDFLESALAEYFVARLSNQDAAVMLERRPPRMPGEAPAHRASDQKWLASTHKRAHYFLTGSVSRLQRNFILTARLTNAYNKEVVPGTSITQACVHESEIYSRVQNMALFLAGQLRRHGVVTPLSETQAQSP